MSRVYNFSAGPAVLPEEVLKEAADEMLDCKGSICGFGFGSYYLAVMLFRIFMLNIYFLI